LVAIAPVKNSTRTHIIGTVEMSRRHMGVWAFGRPQQIYLSNLAIAENCRRQGVARQLLQAAERQARDWGFRELYLHVMMDNLAARNLYQCMEYEVQSVETTLLSLVNVHAPRLLLRKSL
jgi:ribosomal protein S18 acetylase RimI-like enzyme